MATSPAHYVGSDHDNCYKKNIIKSIWFISFIKLNCTCACPCTSWALMYRHVRTARKSRTRRTIFGAVFQARKWLYFKFWILFKAFQVQLLSSFFREAPYKSEIEDFQHQKLEESLTIYVIGNPQTLNKALMICNRRFRV